LLPFLIYTCPRIARNLLTDFPPEFRRDFSDIL
jgi:hypothetical protein